MGTEIELQKMPEPIRAALREFLEDEQHYAIYIDAEANRLIIYIQHDITEELENCEFECTQQTKKHLSKEVDEEKIKESCQDSCFVGVTAIVNAAFDDIRERLSNCLNKYGIKHWWEEGWEDVYRYLVVYIQIH